jgi:ParB-like chromosome segregation protein Spo0J
LTGWKFNPRQISVEHGKRLLDSLTEFGQFQTIAITPDNTIVDGHQRNAVWAASDKYGPDYEVDVRVASRNLTDKERAKLVVLAHKGATGEWDFDALANLPGIDVADLVEFGFDEAELGVDSTPDTDAEPQIDRAAELNKKWKVKAGDLWRIGEHRLLCGDSTKREDVQRVMGGEKWDLLFTSPPYAGGDNAGYKPDYYAKTKRFYHHDKDAMTRDEWIAFCNLWMSEAASCKSSDDCPAVVNVMYTANNRDGYGVVMFAGSHPFKVRETVCWDKHAGFPSATKGILSRNWELVFVLSVAEKYRTTQGESEVRFAKWETQRPEQTDTIKATFPIELPAQAINDFGGDTIYEPFCGSGTTMVACENLKRKCRGIEISCDYVAVCLERMATAFPGIKTERL